MLFQLNVFTVYVLGSGNRMYNCWFSCFAILCDGALTLFTTGLIGNFVGI